MIPSPAVFTLLGIVVTEAPNEDAREALGVMVSAMRRAGETNEKILLALADALVDGLRHGNWPTK